MLVLFILFLGKCEDCTTNELIKHPNQSQLLWVFVFIDHADTNDKFDQAVRNISQSTFFLHNIWTTLRFHEASISKVGRPDSDFPKPTASARPYPKEAAGL